MVCYFMTVYNTCSIQLTFSVSFNILSYRFFLSSFSFSPTWPSGPGWSWSCEVCLCMCLYISSKCSLFQSLSLALRSHDQFQASHWTTLLTPPSPPLSPLDSPPIIIIIIFFLFRKSNELVSDKHIKR